MNKVPVFELERKHERVLPLPAFVGRMAKRLAVVLGFIGLSLAIGMAGYSATEGMGAIDAFVNASMILSGMGPLDAPKTFGGKLFAGMYALYSGLAVLVIAAVLLTPIIHRMLHRFHMEEGKKE